MPEPFEAVALEYDFAAALFHNNDFVTSRLPRSRHAALEIGCGSGILALLERLKAMVRTGGWIIILDNCSAVPTPARIVYLAGALLEFVPHLRRFGLSTATRLFRFQTSKPWLDHLASDRYLSEEGFRQVYGGALPGCSLTRLGPFMGVVWEKERA